MSQQPGTIRWKVIVGTWNYPNSLPGLLSSPAIGADGTIYIGGSATDSFMPSDNRLYSISPVGTTNWIFTAGGAFRWAPAIAADGTIYAGARDGFLYAIRTNGTTKWRFGTGSGVPASPAIGADGTVYVTAMSNYFNKVYAVQPSGSLKWVFTMGPVQYSSYGPNDLSSAPAIGRDGTIYVGSLDKHVYAIKPDGTTNWVFAMGALTYSSPAVGADGTIYIGSDDYNLYALDPAGKVKWVFPTGRYIESSPVVSGDNRVYIGSLDGSLYCLNANRGIEWTLTNGMVSASPAIAVDGTIYFASLNPVRLNAVSSSGSALWSFADPATSIVFSSPAIGPDGTVYAAIGQYLYAFNGTAPLQQGPWPMFRRGLNHNARALQCGISEPVALPSVGFGVTLTMEPNLGYRVQGSSDFVNWSDLASLISTNSTMQFIDRTASGFGQRFYRLSTP
jgi:outer membrane protein assembly factor BamB